MRLLFGSYISFFIESSKYTIMKNKKIVIAGGTGFIEGCDLVINLAGRSVNCRYTRRNRQEIADSRVNVARAIGQAIRESTVPPRLWINGASATIYRHAQDRPQDEYTGEFQRMR
jgi:hypothetical protein